MSKAAQQFDGLLFFIRNVIFIQTSEVLSGRLNLKIRVVLRSFVSDRLNNVDVLVFIVFYLFTKKVNSCV